ncbi:MAG: ATPase domain-containing protein [Euryarchaeota archaeon]|nr:ATPase domain-containing protein [Euryarchaeota archaeon]
MAGANTERIPTGIDELDVKLSGGYPKGKAILVTGEPGSGKTIFGLHFLYKACMDGRRCMDIAITLNKKGCTTIFIMDESAYLMTNQVADYSVYGSVRLMVKENPYTEKMERYLTIPKMRSTDITPDLTVFGITSDGIRLKTKTD